VLFGSAAGKLGHGPSLLRQAFIWRATARQDSRLLNNPRKVRNRLVVDGRRLSLAGLPDFRQVSTGQDGQEARCPIKAYAAAAGKPALRASASSTARANVEKIGDGAGPEMATAD
jgi:hypothetical protein